MIAVPNQYGSLTKKKVGKEVVLVRALDFFLDYLTAKDIDAFLSDAKRRRSMLYNQEIPKGDFKYLCPRCKGIRERAHQQALNLDNWGDKTRRNTELGKNVKASDDSWLRKFKKRIAESRGEM